MSNCKGIEIWDMYCTGKITADELWILCCLRVDTDEVMHLIYQVERKHRIYLGLIKEVR